MHAPAQDTKEARWAPNRFDEDCKFKTGLLASDSELVSSSARSDDRTVSAAITLAPCRTNQSRAEAKSKFLRVNLLSSQQEPGYSGEWLSIDLPNPIVLERSVKSTRFKCCLFGSILHHSSLGRKQR